MGVGVAVVGTGAAIVLAVPVALGGLIAAAAEAAATSAPNPVTLGPGVPEEYRTDLLAAAELCPRLSPSLLGAQVDVESAWNPNAESPAGAQGLAQFMPDTWARWGGDLDEDGQDSPFDPGDALRAQARYMCHLLDTMIASGLGGDDALGVIGLALAGYNAGPGAVLTYGGVPPYKETQDYVRTILDKATSPEYALGIGADTDEPRADVPAGGVDAMLPAGYANGRTATQAVAYALTQVGIWRDSGYCLRFVGRVVYQRPWDGGSINEAHMVWDNAPALAALRAGLRRPPRGHRPLELGHRRRSRTHRHQPRRRQDGHHHRRRDLHPQHPRLLRPRLPRLDAPVLQEPAMTRPTPESPPTGVVAGDRFPAVESDKPPLTCT